MIERIQKNLGVPSQSQRSDGFSEGILIGNRDIAVAGIVTTSTPTLDVLRKAVDSGKSVVICREWEAAEYMRDAIASSQKKALIQLPHEAAKRPAWKSVPAGFGHL